MTHLIGCVDTTLSRIVTSTNAGTAGAPASEAAGNAVVLGAVGQDAVAHGAAARDAAARPPDKAPSERYGPTSFFFEDREGTPVERSLRSGRLSVRLQRDPQFLLALALALPVLAVEGASQLALPWLAVAVPIAYVGLQGLLTAWRSAPAWVSGVRLVISLAFVGIANAWLDPTGTWPLLALVIPVVALAATQGGPIAVLIGIAGMTLLLLPLGLSGFDPGARQRMLALAMAAVVVAIGSRRVVASLERSSNRLRRANQRDRRRARQLAAVESVGRLLAREGPTPAALDSVIGVLEGTFGYRYPSVYVWDGFALQLGAQRNYRFPIQTVAPDRGILGRIARTQEAAFLPDARSDPDFLSGDPDVVSEIGVPLLDEGELLGILNVETNGEHRLDDDDLAIMEIVGDRLAASLALGRERQKLTERAALLDRLTTFATVLVSSLDPETMDDQVAAGARNVIPADAVALVTLDEASGEFVIAAISGGDPKVTGEVIQPGEGISGRAISTRTVVVDDHMDRARYPKSVAKARVPDTLTAMSAPMILGDDVVGAVTWLRGDLTKVFTAQEQEVAALLAGKVGLALSNAKLHQQTQNAAITDPLTGLHNRRHFDAVVEREDAIRRRIPAERRRMRSAILFDLDHFGRVNKKFGHQIGDQVLRNFAGTVHARARESDLIARYGGEEFVIILENASRDDAMKIAEEIREAFAKLTVDTGTGDQLTTTVSAGCSSLEQWEVEGSVLLERADVALAMAKAGGRDQVVAA
jgi:diguanylate cyclase (GGDEF)-like protein